MFEQRIKTMKLFFRRIHLYLALAAGLVITSCCLTGALLVFEEELQHAFTPGRYYVMQGVSRVLITQAVDDLRKRVPEAKIGAVKVFADPERTIELSFKKDTKPKKNRGNSKKGPEYNWKAFVNPYTGEIIDFYDVRNSFFYKVMGIHRWLLADDTGKLITGSSTLIFLFIIITGIVLWWPANKNILKARLKLKTDAGWKRTNHDMHIVLGFYASIFLFVFAFTALAWSFKWFNDGIYTVTNSPIKNPEPPKSVVLQGKTKKVGFDIAYAALPIDRQGIVQCTINAPKEDSGVYTLSILRENAAYETATDLYYVDAYTGKVAGSLLFKNRNSGARIRSVFKPLHTGSICGLASKIIACIVALIGAALPLTGYVMWYNRVVKKKRKSLRYG